MLLLHDTTVQVGFPCSKINCKYPVILIISSDQAEEDQARDRLNDCRAIVIPVCPHWPVMRIIVSSFVPAPFAFFVRTVTWYLQHGACVIALTIVNSGLGVVSFPSLNHF